MKIETFQAGHLDALDVQDAQLFLKSEFEHLGRLYESGDAYTVKTDRIIACGGLLWTTRGGHLWGVVAEGAPMLRLHRVVSRALDSYSVRISATAQTRFTAGCRWLEMLGFKRVDTAKSVGIDGSDHHLYVRPA